MIESKHHLLEVISIYFIPLLNVELIRRYKLHKVQLQYQIIQIKQVIQNHQLNNIILTTHLKVQPIDQQTLIHQDQNQNQGLSHLPSQSIFRFPRFALFGFEPSEDLQVLKNHQYRIPTLLSPPVLTQALSNLFIYLLEAVTIDHVLTQGLASSSLASLPQVQVFPFHSSERRICEIQRLDYFSHCILFQKHFLNAAFLPQFTLIKLQTPSNQSVFLFSIMLLIKMSVLMCWWQRDIYYC